MLMMTMANETEMQDAAECITLLHVVHLAVEHVCDV